MMMKINKEFDAVKMMREITDNHNKMYEINPELREKRLSEIRKKYAANIKIKESIRS